MGLAGSKDDFKTIDVTGSHSVSLFNSTKLSYPIELTQVSTFQPDTTESIGYRSSSHDTLLLDQINCFSELETEMEEGTMIRSGNQRNGRPNSLPSIKSEHLTNLSTNKLRYNDDDDDDDDDVDDSISGDKSAKTNDRLSAIGLVNRNVPNHGVFGNAVKSANSRDSAFTQSNDGFNDGDDDGKKEAAEVISEIDKLLSEPDDLLTPSPYKWRRGRSLGDIMSDDIVRSYEGSESAPSERSTESIRGQYRRFIDANNFLDKSFDDSLGASPTANLISRDYNGIESILRKTVNEKTGNNKSKVDSYDEMDQELINSIETEYA